ncbi:MAG: NUDIX domain-containing protein [Saprospiraceae bacterium]
MIDTQFFNFAFSVDCVIFGFDQDALKILLIRRGQKPFDGDWALPGNLVFPNEDLDFSATRVLEELTGMKKVFLEQVQTFGKVDRHPLGRVITTAYFALVKVSDFSLIPSSLASEAAWVPIRDLDHLAFDHFEILRTCYELLKKSIRVRPVGFELLPPEFTLTDLQLLYESILETSLDKRNFRKKILAMNLLVDVKAMKRGFAHRPAKLYRFDEDKYKAFRAEGFVFEI